MIVYGRQAVHEALRGRRTVSRIWATAGAAREPWLSGCAIEVTLEPAGAIATRAGSSAHQGICAAVSEFRYVPEDRLLEKEQPLLVALDQIQDPQNLGAICRCAECAGAAGVVLPERRSAEVTAAVCKASAGAVEHLQIARVRNLADFLLSSHGRGFWCYGAEAGAPTDYRAVDLSGPVILVLGSEGSGLRPRVASACDALISLPLYGRIQSLSVANAAAVLLYTAAASR